MTNLIFLTKLGTVILLVCFLCMTSCKADIGDACSVDGNCTNTNEKCVNDTCGCFDTHYSDGSICQPRKDPGVICGSTQECKETLTCSTTCKCAATDYWTGTACATRKDPGAACGNIQECKATLTCSTTCKCAATDYWTGTACATRKDPGAACGNIQECKATLTCSTTCKCAATDYWTGTTCATRKDPGAACGNIQECKATLTCSTTCKCAATEYWTGTACATRKDPGAACGNIQECKATLTCSTTCKCAATDYWTGTACATRKDPGAACGNIQECKATLTCSTTCKCAATDYWTGTACATRKDPGAACGNIQECKATLTCSTTCKCAATDYWTGTACATRKDPGAACGNIQECKATLTCSTTCKCAATEYWTGTACATRKDPGAACGNIQECKATLTCSTTCKCAATEYWTGTACATRKDPGAACGNIQECKATLTCSTTCKCAATEYWTGTACATRKDPGAACGNIQECKATLTCSTTCKCAATEYWTGTACATRKDPGAACGNIQECKATLTCSTTCKCAATEYWTGTACATKKDPGAACGNIQECKATLTCSTTCKCAATEYWTGTACATKKDPGAACGNIQECKATLTCSTTCKCAATEYWTGTACATKRLPGGQCTTADTTTECLDVNSVCTTENGGNKCRCKTNYFDNDLDNSNVGGTCTQKRLPGGQCTTADTTTECLDVNSVCTTESGGNKCRCKTNYFDNDLDNSNVAGTCTQKSILGEGCIKEQPANQCSVTNTECIANTTGGSVYKCLCMANYYMDSQTCKPLTDLRVLNLDVPDVSTGETFFLVTWTNPTTVSFIFVYQLILYVSAVVESAMNVDKTKTNVNVTNRIPGREYTITIRSVETASRPSAQVTHVTFTDGTRPAIPGAITQSVFNAPATSITWTITGDVEHFSGTINDTSASPPTFNMTAVNGQPPPLTVSNLRHGERYTFTVRSHSNGFTSDSYIQIIRTTPTTPTPPTHFACAADNIFDRSMTLTWKEPVPPNGDIQHFIILDKTRGQQIQTSGSVEQQLVDQIQPETYYAFTIKTVNDAQSGNSQESSSIACRTTTALASPPQNAVSSHVTPRSITTQWDHPADTEGVIQAYRLTVRNITDDKNELCVREIILQCNVCGLKQNLNYVGNCGSQELMNKTPVQMNQTMSHSVANLYPYVQYRIRIQTVNAKGDGQYVDIINTTLEELPQKPALVTGVAHSDPKVLQVSWQQPSPRPGITTYTVRVYEENDELNDFIYKETFNKVISGYYTQNATIDGLEEHWQYMFEIEATTVIGSMRSDRSPAVRTNHAGPGKVVNLIVSNPTDIYNQMDVKWSIPLLRERKSVIAQYIVNHNISGTKVSLTVPAEDDTLMRSFNVTPEQTYLVQVYAVNKQGQNGDKVQVIFFAPPFQGDYGDSCIPDTVRRCKHSELVCHPSIKRCLCADTGTQYWDFTSNSCKLRSSDTGYSAGALAGMGVGSVVLSVTLMTVIICVMRRRQMSDQSNKSREPERDNRYEDIGLENASNYEILGTQSQLNVYDRIQTPNAQYQNI